MTPDSSHPMSRATQPDWLDQIIENAREQGEFDDLPGKGEPLKLAPESAAPSEYDLAFTMLSNAGYAPYFMELGKEIESLEESLVAFRDRADVEINELLRALEQSDPVHVQMKRPSIWQRLWRGSSDDRARPAPPTRDGVALRRQELALRHATMAAELDEKIATYHAAMPRELWQAQRSRRTAEEWAELFDSACPPVNSEPAESIRAQTP